MKKLNSLLGLAASNDAPNAGPFLLENYFIDNNENF